MAHISLVIGSGLSIPAGFPSTSELNKRLSKIDATDIYIHTDGSAWFLNEQDPNANWIRVKERKFIQKFIEFYNTEILEEKNNFNYEVFYDYYQIVKESGEYPNELNNLFTEFVNGEITDGDKNQLLFEFNMYFNQLIGNLLFKKFSGGQLCNPYHSSCDAFLNLVEKIGEKFIVNIHSLNHDLYLEHLSSSDSIQAEMDDGFEEIGSQYYGELFHDQERYFVRLSRFTNKYSKKFRLFKLHGSIDNYWFGYENEFDLIKLKYGISQNDIYKEIEESNKKEYFRGNLQVYPDFLSGQKYKVNKYTSGSYYPKVFDHFNKNLENSKSLIIIGYGFKDEEINNCIDAFIQNKSKKIFVVDISKPKHPILGKENVVYIEGGVVNMNYEYIVENVV